jgi:hypothetical protein
VAVGVAVLREILGVLELLDWPGQVAPAASLGAAVLRDSVQVAHREFQGLQALRAIQELPARREHQGQAGLRGIPVHLAHLGQPAQVARQEWMALSMVHPVPRVRLVGPGLRGLEDHTGLQAPVALMEPSMVRRGHPESLERAEPLAEVASRELRVLREFPDQAVRPVLLALQEQVELLEVVEHRG